MTRTMAAWLIAAMLTVFISISASAGNVQPSGTSGGSGPVTNVQTESTGTVTCDLSLGSVCDIVRNTNGALTITVNNLPTNQFVTFIQDTATNSKGLTGTTWTVTGGTAFCPSVSISAGVGPNADTTVACPANLNGHNNASGKYTTHAFSDGTNLWIDGNGLFQTINTSHLNANQVQIGNNGLNANYNGHITWNSVSSGAGSLAVSSCGTTPSGSLQTHSSDDFFVFTGGGTTTTCTITFNLAFTSQPNCVCSDETHAVPLLVTPAANGATLVVSGFTQSDTVACHCVSL